MPVITFHKQDTTYNPARKAIVREWVKSVAAKHGKRVGELAFIFCSDEHLLRVNRQYLNHDNYTDIITFDYSDETAISGDIFISVDRVKENAETRGLDFADEMSRVMIHGVLHLLGFKDKGPVDKKRMTAEEDISLATWKGLQPG